MKVVSVPCPQCRQDVACPANQVGQPVLCPHCNETVVFSHEDLGIKPEKAWELPRWAQWALAACPLALSLVLGFLLLPEEGTGTVVKSPELTLRCARCNRSFRMPQKEWGEEVHRVLSEKSQDQGNRQIRLPETTPMRCPDCGSISAYCDTILVREAGLLNREHEFDD